MDGKPFDDQKGDSVNTLEMILATKGEIQRFRAAYSKDSWDELRSSTRDALLQGVAALRGLQVAASSTTTLRYMNWLDVNSRAFLQALNQLPECVASCGAPLIETDLVLKNLQVVLDRVLVDLVLLTAKTKRDRLAQRQERFESEEQYYQVEVEALRLIRCLHSLSLELTHEWDSRIRNQLNHHLDGAVCLLLRQLALMTKEWVIALVTVPNVVIHTMPSEGTDLQTFETTPPSGELLSCHFVFGDNADHVWRNILSANGIASTDDFKMPHSFSSLADSERPEACSFQVRAHTDAIHDVCVEYLCAVSGLLALLRTTATEEWQREVLSISRSGLRYRVTLGDPRIAKGVAIPISGGMHSVDGDEDLVTRDGDGSDAIALSVPSVIVPLDASELQRAEKLLALPFMEAIVLGMGGPAQLPSMLQKLKKTFHFWTRAELRRAGLKAIEFTAWSLAEVFLDYCMVLEILLGEKSEVVQIVSSRAAVLLSDDPEGRMKAFGLIKDLYGKRSRYVHEGVVSVRHRDVLDIRDVVRQCLLYALKWTSFVAKIKYASDTQKHDEKLAVLRTAFKRREFSPEVEQSGQEVFNTLFGHAHRFGRHCDALRFGAPRLAFDSQECIERLSRELADDDTPM
jgi:hypothetical protein